MFRSYAQHFEDVILWRALKHIEHGTYVDIGANDPVIDSISLAFYERGWRGIHVEPMPQYAASLRQARPDEKVIEAAISISTDTIRLFEFANTGLTTANAKHAHRHEASGWQSRELVVPARSLASVLDELGSAHVHWLKIDVEGMESDVLDSWGSSPARPWVLVIESTIPLSGEQDWQRWQSKVTSRGYQFVYADGLNRFYVHDAHRELVDSFGPGPNYFDHFTLTKYSPFVTELVAATATSQQSLEALLDLRDKSLATMSDKLQSESAAAIAARSEVDVLSARLATAAAAEQQVHELKATLNAKITDLTKADVEVAKLTGLLAERSAAVSAKDAEIAALKSDLVVSNSGLSVAVAELADHKKSLVEHRGQSESLLAALKSAAMEGAQHRHQANELLASTSWRITKPIRIGKKAALVLWREPHMFAPLARRALAAVFGRSKRLLPAGLKVVRHGESAKRPSSLPPQTFDAGRLLIRQSLTAPTQVVFDDLTTAIENIRTQNAPRD